MHRLFFRLFLTASILFHSVASANLLVSPTRVNFDSRDRVQEVILINSGEQARTYRVTWVENKAKEDGGYITTTIEDPTLDALSPFIRFSPRQVTLQPGERQTVKLQLRKKPDMDADEYRSHLLFTALPPEANAENQADNVNSEMSIRLDMLMNYSIPVLYHPNRGNVAIDATFEKINPRLDGGADFQFRLDRKGSVSAFGRIELYSNINGERTRIGVTNNVSVFRELEYRNIMVRVPNFENIKSQLDSFEVHYVGEKEHMGQIFTTKTVQL